MLILGIETSCDETGAAVYDTNAQKIISNALFSQIALHEIYGGVVPEIASRSQLEKINPIVEHTLTSANLSISDIDAIAVTTKPGLVGSLLVGICFAKGIAWATGKKIIAVDHLEGHIFSAFLKSDNSLNTDLQFPFISLTASGGHTSIYLVTGFGSYKVIGQTLDDAAGEAFDKVAKTIGLGYPGGAQIEKLAKQVDYKDFFKYPRTRSSLDNIAFSFSGLKTAVLYDLVKKGAYDLHKGPISTTLTPELQQQVASSLLVCMGDVFCNNITLAFQKYPEATALSFGGGVACNSYLRNRLNQICIQRGKSFCAAPPRFCTDNGAMIAFVGSYKAQQNKFADLSIDAGS
jgi:N6-L-threonylcarbamoyladenine synthase